MNKRFCLLLAIVAVVGCKRSPPADVAATVNSRAITFAELEKTYKSQYNSSGENDNADLVSIQKLEVLRSLIDNEIMQQRAEKTGLMATDADVDTKLNELRAPYTKEQFGEQLKSRNMTLDELKVQLRKDLSVQKLFNKEITSKINITDSDVSGFYAANRKSFNLTEPQIHLMQIVVTPVADSNARNLKGDKAKTDEEAAKKIQMLEGRLKQGQEFTILAQNYSEDANTAASGGDLGYVPESALEKTGPDLYKLILSLQPGQLSPILKTQDGYRILKMISREPAGQRELSDPRVQQSIRENLLTHKDQLLKSAYYEVARNDAKIANYVARGVIDNSGKNGK